MTLIGDALRGAAQVRAQSHRQVGMALGEFVLPLVGAALATVSWQAPLARAGVPAPARPGRGAGARRTTRSEAVQTGYARELQVAVAQPGMPGVLTAGFLRFVCKFALVAYLPLLLVRWWRLARSGRAGAERRLGRGRGDQLRRRAGCCGATSASLLLGAAVVVVGVTLLGFALAPNWQVALAVAVVFGIADGTLSVVQNALVTEAAPAGVRAGLVAVERDDPQRGQARRAACDGRR